MAKYLSAFFREKTITEGRLVVFLIVFSSSTSCGVVMCICKVKLLIKLCCFFRNVEMKKPSGGCRMAQKIDERERNGAINCSFHRF